MLDLESPGALKLLSAQIHTDIDKFCIQKYNDGHRGHLGASVIGKPCLRELWYNFRWMHNKVHDGRQYRLFQRGHLEESRVHDYLLGIGCTVTIFDKVLYYHPGSDDYFYDSPDAIFNLTDDVDLVEGYANHEAAAIKKGVFIDKGKRQIRISGCKGHFAGSVDAKIKLPERYNIQQDVLFLGEYKTIKTEKFAKLQRDGVKIDKYQHFCQKSVYGLKLGLQYGIYVSVNKNNDDLCVEVIKLDWFLGQELENKAEKIIFSQTPPNKISMSASYFDCKWCDMAGICWYGKPIDINCRSCKSAIPVDNAEWFCNQFGSIIPKDFVKTGCTNKWESLL